MKIICISGNYPAPAEKKKQGFSGTPGMYLKPETALIRGRMPFFLPDFSDEIHAGAELVLRIGKLGKNIQPRFARTYYTGIGLAVNFTATDHLQKCIREGNPWDEATAFDGSVKISDFVPTAQLPDPDKISFSLKCNGDKSQHGLSGQMRMHFNQLIAYVSSFITLKIGDYLLTGSPPGCLSVKQEDKLEAFLAEQQTISMSVK
ncbi:MAG: fumarylacetoacetate hydrolase family protein [Bacteroidales bacterium]